MTIYQVVIVDNSTGEIVGMYVPGATPPDEGTDASDNTKSIVHLTSNVPDPPGFQKTQYRKDGAWKTREWKGNFYKWKADESWEFDSTGFWKSVREDRNYRLFTCDWTQLADTALSDSKKAEWASYRGELRVLPENNSGAKSLEEIVWPTKPS